MNELVKTADLWGVETEYEDSKGTKRRVPEDTVRRVLHSMDATGASHRSKNSIKTPGGRSLCYFPRRLRIWGWMVQLYAARSQKSWGIGDLGDLKELASWASKRGAGMIMINPLHAPSPIRPQQASPYYPSSRVYRNPLYLRIEAVPGAEHAGLDQLTERGRALNASRLIDRDAIFDLKVEALERIWQLGHSGDGFEKFIREEGDSLLDYSTFCVAIEIYSPNRQRWPAAVLSRNRDSLDEFQNDNADRIRFHQWIQWLIDRQLELAAKEIPIVTDLAIGVDPRGADAWIWQNVFVDGVSVGAPPDEFNRDGQAWGVSPMDPWKLASCSFEPFEKTLSSSLRHASGVRIDHVMGLFRQFWIPEGLAPSQGTYVRYPSADLLEMVARESRRHKALVIGEDLGTVAPGVREEMAARKMLSQKVLWFESDPPESWPNFSMASVTTHDLPTIAGLWSGHDLELQRIFTSDPNEEGAKALMQRLEATLRLPPNVTIPDLVLSLHEHVAKSSSSIALATLEDAAAVEERPNIPGSTRRENWSLALPLPLEDLFESDLAAGIAEILRRRS